MKEYYYYVRDGEATKGERFATVCLVTNGQDVARGIAVCSEMDNFNRKVGRNISKGRAMQALINKKNGLPVYTLSRLPPEVEWFVTKNNMLFKSEFNPTLTSYENGRVKK